MRAVRYFRIQYDAGRFVAFNAGDEIPEEWASHWYAIENSALDPGESLFSSKPAPEPEPQVEAQVEAAPEPAASEAPAPAPVAEEPANEFDTDGDGELSKAELIAMAEELGIDVDKRWGVTKLREAIDAAMAKDAPA